MIEELRTCNPLSYQLSRGLLSWLIVEPIMTFQATRHSCARRSHPELSMSGYKSWYLFEPVLAECLCVRVIFPLNKLLPELQDGRR
jgi:hypothetical protein